MHLYDAIEEYNFDHEKHFDTVTGQYDLLMPHDLGRPLTHEEMDYNFLYQKQTMNGFRIFGSGVNLRLNTDDTDKVLKFHQIDPLDDNYNDYTAAGYVTGQWIWIPEEVNVVVVSYISLVANPTTINETNNNTTTFTLTTLNATDGTTVNWSIATGNGITANDFIGGSLTGTATITNNTATWNVAAAADNFTELNETFTLTLASIDSQGNDTTTLNAGNPLSADVTIVDTSSTPAYVSLAGNVNSVAEGGSITYTVNTQNFFQAATATWGIDFTQSAANAADFTASTGTVNIDANGNGTFTITTVSDFNVEPNENFVVRLVGNDSNGVPTNISTTSTITNVAFPTYTTFTGPATRFEGQTATYLLEGTNIPAGTQVGYTITGVDVTDISLQNLTGFITMNNFMGNQVGQLQFSILEDYIPESPEDMVITLNGADSAGNTTGLPMAVTTQLIDVASTYTIDGSGQIVEGETKTYTFKATNMSPGTFVYWELRNYVAGSYVDWNADIVSPRTGNGQVVQVGNEVHLTFDIEVANDYTSGEGDEYLKIVVWDDAANYDTANPDFGSVVSGALATKDITVVDLAPQWQLTTVGDPVAGGEDDQAEPEVLTFNILTRYVPVGTPFTWEAKAYGANPAAAADFDGGNWPTDSGTVSTFNNTISLDSQFTTSVIADNTTENDPEQYILELSDANGVVASKIINITDNSQTPAAYLWSPYGNPNNENGGIGYWATNDEGTTYQWQLAQWSNTIIPAGQQIWWRVETNNVSNPTNPASAADFSGGVLPSGNFVTQTAGTVGDSTTVALWSVTINADTITDGVERYDMKLYTDNTYTTELQLAGANQNYVRVTINDTSQAPTFDCGDAGLTINAGITGQTVTGSVANGTLVGSFNPPTYGSGNQSYSINITVPAVDSNGNAYSNAGVDIPCSANAAGTNPTFALTNNGPVNEGQNITWTLTTANVASGTTVPFTLSGTASSPQDYSNNQPFQFTVGQDSNGNAIGANTATYFVTTFADNLTDMNNPETVILTLAASDSAGNVIPANTFSTANINDTSQTPTYSTITAQTVNEGQNMTFTLSTANVANGTTVNFAFSGTATQGTDYTVPGALQMTINNNSATYTIATVADQITESGASETVIMTLNATDSNGFGTNSITGTGTINDTSQAPQFDCTDAGLTINNGTVGDPVTGSVSNGTLVSFNPSTYQSGSVTYTAQITAPAANGSGVAYGNAGQNIPCTANATGTAPQVYYYSFHGGGANGYPYTQSADGLTDPSSQTLYYDDGSNAYATTTDLSVAMAAVMNGSAGFPNPPALVNGANFTAMGTSDAISYPSTGTAEFYYIVAPDGLEDLTSVSPQHLVDGGVDTNAVQKKSFTWNGNLYWLYKLGGGDGTALRTITFSDLD